MFLRLFKLTNNKLFKYQFMRFATVGTLGVVIDFGTLVFLVEVLKIHYLWAATTGFILATISNYILNKLWTFENPSQRYARQYLLFLCVSVAGLAINNGVLYVGVELLNIYYILSKVIASLVVLFWNFFVNKHVTFKLI